MKPSSASRLARPRIAIIDDDEDTRALLRHSLELRGYQVLEFESTEEALGWERKPSTNLDPPISKADLILLDVNLPGISGVDTIRLLKETDFLKRIPIAMLTAHGEAETVRKSIRAGASDYFVKPLSFPEVFERIEKLIADPNGLLAKTAAVEVSWKFQEILVREIKRSERSSLPLALVIGAIRKGPAGLQNLSSSDVDRFWLNPQGENDLSREATSQFLESARQNLREYDLLVPFGRGEMAGILPGTDRSGLETVIRKLHGVFESETDLPPLSRRERWILMLGGAVYPDEAGDSLGLYTHAETTITDRIPETPTGPLGDDQVYSRTVRCAACNHHFVYPKIAARRLVPVGRETDLRLVYDGIDPLLYGAVVCPDCGISALEGDLKFLRRLDPPAFGWNYSARERGTPISRRTQTLIPEELVDSLSPPYEAWISAEEEFQAKVNDLPVQIRNRAALLEPLKKEKNLRPSGETALRRYYLVRETYALAGASPLRRAKAAHRIAWLYRSQGQSERETQFLTEALGFYLTAFHFEELSDTKPGELEILYLMGELNFRIGRETDAVAILHHLVRDSRLDSNASFRRMVRRRWFEARHEEPPAEEELAGDSSLSH